MSAQFAKKTLNSKNKVKIHGVTRYHQKGVPKIIEKKKYQINPKAQYLHDQPTQLRLVSYGAQKYQMVQLKILNATRSN